MSQSSSIEQELSDQLCVLAECFCQTEYALLFHLELSSLDLSDPDEVSSIFFEPPADLSTKLDIIAHQAVMGKPSAEIAEALLGLRVRPVHYEEYVQRKQLADDESCALGDIMRAIAGTRQKLVSQHVGKLDGYTETERPHALEGLRRAARRFDPSRGYTFWSYATHWVQTAVQGGFAKQ